MDAGEDAHRHVTRIVTHEHLVDLENRAELSIESFSGNVRQVEINLVLSTDTHTIETHLKDRARCDVTRHEIAVSRILLFEEIQSLLLRNRRRRTNVTFVARHPNTPAFAARRLRHQSQLVFARNRGRMNLDKFAVRVSGTLLITRRHGTAGTDHRIRRLPEDQTWTTGRDDHRISRERFELERLKIHRDQSTTNLMIVEDERHHFPVFILLDFTCDFKASDL